MFYGMSTFMGYLMLNPVEYICKPIVVEGDPKASFSVATTSVDGATSFPRLLHLSWSIS